MWYGSWDGDNLIATILRPRHNGQNMYSLNQASRRLRLTPYFLLSALPKLAALWWCSCKIVFNFRCRHQMQAHRWVMKHGLRPPGRPFYSTYPFYSPVWFAFSSCCRLCLFISQSCLAGRCPNSPTSLSFSASDRRTVALELAFSFNIWPI